jgi:hypothetical protein
LIDRKQHSSILDFSEKLPIISITDDFKIRDRLSVNRQAYKGFKGCSVKLYGLESTEQFQLKYHRFAALENVDNDTDINRALV